MPSRITISCPFSVELLNSLEKCALQAASTSRCALNDSPASEGLIIHLFVQPPATSYKLITTF